MKKLSYAALEEQGYEGYLLKMLRKEYSSSERETF